MVSTADYGSTPTTGGFAILTLDPSQIPGTQATDTCYPNLVVTKRADTPTATQGGTAKYTITVTNTGTARIAQGVRLSDALPASPNFSFATTDAIVLGGGATRPATTNPTVGATSPQWGDFRLPPSGSASVQFTANVNAATPAAVYQNPASVSYLDPTRTVATTTVSPGGTYAAGGTVGGSNYNAAPADDDVTIRQPVGITKTFVPGNLVAGDSSLLTLTLTNPNTIALTNASFTDTYPAGLVNRATPGALTSCAGGSVSAAANGSSVSLSGGTILASGSCTVSVSVTTTATGSYTNTLAVNALSTAQV